MDDNGTYSCIKLYELYHVKDVHCSKNVYYCSALTWTCDFFRGYFSCSWRRGIEGRWMVCIYSICGLVRIYRSDNGNEFLFWTSVPLLYNVGAVYMYNDRSDFQWAWAVFIVYKVCNYKGCALFILSHMSVSSSKTGILSIWSYGMWRIYNRFNVGLLTVEVTIIW